MSIFNVPRPPTIPANTNIDNNSTRLLKSKSTEASLSISDGIATIKNGFISNLFNPVNNNEIATKYYVDNFGGASVPSPPPSSIQINDGLFPAGFIGYPNFTFNNGTNTMTVDNLTNGTITIGSGRIGGLVNPTLPQEAATKSYVDAIAGNALTQVNVTSIVGINTQFTAAQFINTIINRIYLPNVGGGISCGALDGLPLIADIISYLGSKFQVGYTWTTLILMPKNFDQIQTSTITGVDPHYVISPIYYVCGLPFPAVSMLNFSSVLLTSVVQDITPGSELITAYVISSNLDSSLLSQITDQGILSSSFANVTGITGINILPITNNPAIVSSSSQLYTYSVVKKQLIVRSGLSGITTDTLDSVANFVLSDVFKMGGGTFTLSVQNISAFNLTIGLGAGWTVQGGNSLVIPPAHCGNFWLSIDLTGPSGIIRNLGTFPLNGP